MTILFVLLLLKRKYRDKNIFKKIIMCDLHLVQILMKISSTVRTFAKPPLLIFLIAESE